MFKSEFSGKQVDANVSPVKVVTHKRHKVYTQKDKYNVEFEVGRGWEIAKEMFVAPDEVEEVKAKYGEGIFINQPAPAYSAPVYSSGGRYRD